LERRAVDAEDAGGGLFVAAGAGQHADDVAALDLGKREHFFGGGRGLKVSFSVEAGLID